MYLGRVIGTLIATRKDQSLEGHRLLIVQPLDDQQRPDGDPHVAVDTVSAGRGELVFLVGSREAAEALPARAPVDAAIVGIVDRIDVGTTTGRRSTKNLEDC